MANIIFRGSNAPQLQEWKQTYRVRRGMTGEYSFKGVGTIDGLENMAQQTAIAELAGYDWELSYKFGVAEIQVRTPDGYVGTKGSGAQTIIDKWEVATDEEKPSLFENQNFIGLIQQMDGSYGGNTYATISQQIISTILAAVNSVGTDNPLATAVGQWISLLQNNQALDDSGAALNLGGPGAGVNNTTLYDLILDVIGLPGLGQLEFFFKDYARGATNFVHSKYVLRHTTNVPNNYISNVADFNVETIYTISQLLSEAQNPRLWILPLPAYLAYKIINYPVPVNLFTDYLFGGLKMRSNAVTTARNRIEITQEYLIDAWPVHTYGLIS